MRLKSEIKKPISSDAIESDLDQVNIISPLKVGAGVLVKAMSRSQKDWAIVFEL